MSASSNLLHLDNQLCFSLYSASLMMTQLYKPLLEPLGLTYPQYLVLLVLWEKNGLALKDVAQQLGQKPGALTPVIKRMEKDGILTRVRSEKDERYIKILLTPHAEQLKAKAKAVNQSIIGHCGLNLEDIDGLKSQLDKLKLSLQKNPLTA